MLLAGTVEVLEMTEFPQHACHRARLSQCNKRQARAQTFFALISINLVPKVV